MRASQDKWHHSSASAVSPRGYVRWFLTGPTASGKTAVGLALAQRLNADIISLDSMALYRGMDIGTAKPTAAERAVVPHHLLDCLDPADEYSLAQYVAAANAVSDRLHAQGKTVLLVGGTPLYLKALLRGIFEGPPADWAFRRDWETRAARQPPGFLHAELARRDPAAAARLAPGDTRRIIRALEVLEKTGTPISQYQTQFNQAADRALCRVFCLQWPRDILYRRINRRVEQMFARGLVEEVRELAARGPFGRTAAQALGYREVLEHLAGRLTLPETIAQVQARTRQFAKRQLTWFRSLPECLHVPLEEPLDAEAVAQRIISLAPPAAQAAGACEP